MNVDHIHWLGHASFRIEDQGKQIYIDPWKLKTGKPKADLIFITHSHYDHHSIEDIRKITHKNTLIVGPADVMQEHKNQGYTVTPGDTKTIAGLSFVVLPAYNLNKSFHPKSKNWVGYNIMLTNGQTIYHPGDTDFIPEMKSIKTDIFLPPVGGTYTMDAVDAATACSTIKPQVVIPMHWGDIVGVRSDVDLLEALITVRVEIKEPE